MSAKTKTVYVKALTGDLISLDVDPSSSLSHIQYALAAFDPVVYPVYCTTIFPLEEEDHYGVFLTNYPYHIDPIIEHTFEGGNKCLLIHVTFASYHLYIHVRSYYHYFLKYSITYHPISNKSKSHKWWPSLYELLTAVNQEDMGHYTSPSILRKLENTIVLMMDDYYAQKQYSHIQHVRPTFMQCRCRAIIQYTRISKHLKSKQHTDYENACLHHNKQ